MRSESSPSSSFWDVNREVDDEVAKFPNEVRNSKDTREAKRLRIIISFEDKLNYWEKEDAFSI